MKPEKLTLKQLKKRWNVEVDNILDAVESDKLNMYVRAAVWKYDAPTHKDEISIYLADQNIKGVLSGFKIEKETVEQVRIRRKKKTFTISPPWTNKENKTKLKNNIKDWMLHHLHNLTVNYVKDTKFVESKIMPTQANITIAQQKKCESIIQIVKDGESDSLSWRYKVKDFFPLSLITEYGELGEVSLNPNPVSISKSIKFDDIYFLEKNVKEFENKSPNEGKEEQSKEKPKKCSSITIIRRNLLIDLLEKQPKKPVKTACKEVVSKQAPLLATQNPNSFNKQVESLRTTYNTFIKNLN